MKEGYYNLNGKRRFIIRLFSKRMRVVIYRYKMSQTRNLYTEFLSNNSCYIAVKLRGVGSEDRSCDVIDDRALVID